VVKVYSDRGISGAKGRDKRPGFDALCKDAVRREFDVVLAWSVDRLGRSLQDLIGFLSEIHAAGVDLYLHVQGLDTSTPSGKAMFQMLGVFAEFERSLIRERVMAGLARARRQGTKSGRPSGRPKSTGPLRWLFVRHLRRATVECARSPPTLASVLALCSASRPN
jgi:DNA invertase Pin-like site-specific DNA recombinase